MLCVPGRRPHFGGPDRNIFDWNEIRWKTLGGALKTLVALKNTRWSVEKHSVECWKTLVALKNTGWSIEKVEYWKDHSSREMNWHPSSRCICWVLFALWAPWRSTVAPPQTIRKMCHAWEDILKTVFSGKRCCNFTTMQDLSTKVRFLQIHTYGDVHEKILRYSAITRYFFLSSWLCRTLYSTGAESGQKRRTFMTRGAPLNYCSWRICNWFEAN
jgi:hypothetical protein